FLDSNYTIPSRFVEVDGAWQLNRKTGEQFPVFPDSEQDIVRQKAPVRDDVHGEFENYHAGWAWTTFAQEPLPPFKEGEPEDEPPQYNPLRYRKPRQPALIIFRQQPA